MIVLGLVSFLGQPASASRRSRWNDLQRRINSTRRHLRDAKKRERGIIAQINASDLRRQRLEDALSSLGVQLGDAEGRLDILTRAANTAQSELDKRTHDLEDALTLLGEQVQVLNGRVAEKYMQGPANFAPVLLNSSDFTSFVAADQYVASVLTADVAAIDQVRGLRDQIRAERATLGRRKQVIDQQVSALEAERNKIATLRARQASARIQVVDEINFRKTLLGKVRDEERAWEDALASYQRESDSITGLLHNFQSGQTVIRGAGHGYLVWPVSGHISSPYGWRIHPIYHKRSFHTGIDIAAPSGSRIGAAKAGKVVYTGYKGAYGLIVIVDHGDSVATLYAHMSREVVSPGDRVSRGQTLGYVGCTGWCTGPHVHFETRVSGQPTNPTRWL
ncbi:MAG: peptidoglycan DD-metalloendopeptidase family protein [Actinomycetota bacterium]